MPPGLAPTGCSIYRAHRIFRHALRYGAFTVGTKTNLLIARYLQKQFLPILWLQFIHPADSDTLRDRNANFCQELHSRDLPQVDLYSFLPYWLFIRLLPPVAEKERNFGLFVAENRLLSGLGDFLLQHTTPLPPNTIRSTPILLQTVHFGLMAVHGAWRNNFRNRPLV